MRFCIENVWYDAPTYAAARELHNKAKGLGGSPVKPQTPPLPFSPPAVQNQPPAFTLPKKLDPPPLPKVVKPTTPSEQSFDLVCYRGEKKQWWSPPEDRLICGMTLYQPWNLLPGINSMKDLWEHLRKFMQQNSFGKVDAFAQYLRAQGRPFAVAAAWTETGSFTSDYNYVIKIPNARTFLWGPKLTLGAPAGYKKPSDVTADYIVLNADKIEDSTVLAFGHAAGTFEITFLHDLNINFIESCNGKPVSTMKFTSTANLSVNDKVKLSKYLRYGQNWL